MHGHRTENPSASAPAVRRRVRVRGIVQGVGFRPTVYRLAVDRALGGWVLNDAEGVLVEVEGPAAKVDDFLCELRDHPPPLAQVTSIEAEAVPAEGADGFRILASGGGDRVALVSPDMAICPDCLRELLDPADRRFRYPFINCTNCGPRYSIILDIPYDRPSTTMRGFTMCTKCRNEYEDPGDRRFHAQPNACPACGPHLALVSPSPLAGEGRVRGDAVQAVREALLAGRIVAIKGLTGFHLACDARSDAAVAELRRRKGRDRKPFAMMAASVGAIAREAVVSDAERALLESRERPIVLLRKRPDHRLAAGIAPASPRFGFMLPYAPVHYLLFEGEFPPLVMTSGNLSEEPICREDQEALGRLAGIADLYLLHDRPIQTVCDDSVALVQRERPLMLRRGRGYAPRPLRLPVRSPAPILAVGPELKNAVCLVRGAEAFVSQHIGDLKNALAAQYFEATIEKMERLLEIRPAVIAHDLHPAYLSTRYARRRAEGSALRGGSGDPPRDALRGGSPDPPRCEPPILLGDAAGQETRRAEFDGALRLIGVQHHHAHIAAVMAENELEGELLGLAMDGTGYGTDGAVWGSEILRASATGFERLGHLAYVALPGGDAAIEHPVRTAWAFLVQAMGAAEAERHLAGRLADTRAEDRRLWADLIERGLHAPRTSGLGRLFDAASVLAGVCAENSYEGQAAIELEAAAEDAPDDAEPYDFAILDASGGMATRRCVAMSHPRGEEHGHANGRVTMPPGAPQPWVIDTSGLIRGVVADIEAGRGAADVSARFHATVAAMLLAAAEQARGQSGLGRVALAGGCFANDRLVRLLAPRLEAAGFEVFVHRDVSPGDGGVALGQAYVAAAQLRAEAAPLP